MKIQLNKRFLLRGFTAYVEDTTKQQQNARSDESCVDRDKEMGDREIEKERETRERER